MASLRFEKMRARSKHSLLKTAIRLSFVCTFAPYNPLSKKNSGGLSFSNEGRGLNQ
jgi:hypothetical protein